MYRNTTCCLGYGPSTPCHGMEYLASNLYMMVLIIIKLVLSKKFSPNTTEIFVFMYYSAILHTAKNPFVFQDIIAHTLQVFAAEVSAHKVNSRFGNCKQYSFQWI